MKVFAISVGLLLILTACGEDEELRADLIELEARLTAAEKELTTVKAESQETASRVEDLGLQSVDNILAHVGYDEDVEYLEDAVALVYESMANTHHLATGNQQDVALLMTTAGVYPPSQAIEFSSELNATVLEIANCLADDVEAVGSLAMRDTWVANRQRAFWLLLGAGRYPSAETIKDIAEFVC